MIKPILPLDKVKLKHYIVYLLFLYPAFFALAFNEINAVNWSVLDFFENVLFTIVFISIGFFINHHYFRKLYHIIIYLFLTIIAFIETSYFFLYQNVISSSAIFILLETNSNEALEYGSALLIKLVFLLIFALVPVLIVIPVIIKLKAKVIIRINIKTVIIYFTGLFFLFGLMKLTHLVRYNLPYTAIKSYFIYANEMNKYEQLVYEKKGGSFSNVKHNDKNDELYVIVIGESNNREHMSLYGYYRQTSPLLEEIKKELLIYEDVICPHVNTILSLSKVLTLGNYEIPEMKFEGSIFQLFNKAEFKTYWLSNQEPMGMHETGITKLTKSADKRFFVNSKSNRKKSPYDEMIFIPLRKILREKASKKIVVIQLLGSHVDYSNRYPEKFKKFTDKPISFFNNENAYKQINAYDNSLLYTDYNVRQIIESVKKLEIKSYVLYFSDHGEDVFKTTNKSFHAEGFKSKYMYEIPFILWRSKKFFNDTNNKFIFDVNRKYMIDDLIYSIADLSNIKFDEFDAKRSLFNHKFDQRKRIILDSLDFDTDL